MESQILFSKKNEKKCISLSSAEFAHRMVIVNSQYVKQLAEDK